MKYILMMNMKAGSSGLNSWPKKDIDAHLAYWDRLNRELNEAGELVAVEALTGPDQARQVRAGKDSVPLADGVFPESKEFLAGFWVVDVETAERAFAIAARASAAPGPGGVPLNMPIEVRQVMKTIRPEDLL
jgi:hypothetical protein